MWDTVRIADFGKVITGKTPSSKSPEHFGDKYPFITPTDMNTGRIVVTERAISEEGYLTFHRQILPPLSVCFVCIGATIGKICMTKEKSLTNQQINSIVVDTKHYDPYFVYYLLSTYEEEVKGVAGGAATPIVNKTTFENLKASAPPLPIQRKIAAILSAYDDLIENNLRRIKILEEMAQNLYREWFVKFRFPGHQHARFDDSSLGPIPEGWEVGKLGDLCLLMQSGGTPSRKKADYWNDATIDWYKTRELWDGFLFNSEERISKLGLSGSSARLFDPGTILMAIYGAPTVGRLGIVTKAATCNQAALGMRADPDKISQYYLFYALLGLRGHFNSIAQGAAQQNISKCKVAEAECLVPPLNLINEFTGLVEPIWGALRNLQTKNTTLRRTRDLLLPRLISGEVDVSELDICIPEEVST